MAFINIKRQLSVMLRWLVSRIVVEFLWNTTLKPAFCGVIDNSHIVLGVILASYIIPLKDSNTEIRELMPLLTSKEPLNRSLAFTYAKERGLQKKFPEYFKKIGEYTELEVRELYKNPQLAFSQPNIISYSNMNLLDDHLNRIVKQTIEKEKSKDMAALKMKIDTSNIDLKPNKLQFAIDRGTELLNQKRCYSAFVAFWDAAQLDLDSKIPWSGMSIASTCIENQNAQAYNQLTMEIYRAKNIHDSVRRHENAELQLRKNNEALDRMESEEKRKNMKKGS